jgi:diphthine synthase
MMKEENTAKYTLNLIGLGLETKDISIRAMEAIRSSDIVYLEQYTTIISDDYVRYLREETGKEIFIVGRHELEEGSKSIIEASKSKTVSILVPGDPLVATTHCATILDIATRLGVRYKVYHASSIFSAAIGSSGLDVYKFGQIVTIPYWYEKYKPVSFIDTLSKNLRNNEHTLLLLDINADEKRHMKLEEAFKILRDADLQKGTGIIHDDLKILVLGDVGMDAQEIAYVKVKDAYKIYASFAKRKISLIIPSGLSFAEEESISKFKKGP